MRHTCKAAAPALGLNITRQIVWRQAGNIGFRKQAGGNELSSWFTVPRLSSGPADVRGRFHRRKLEAVHGTGSAPEGVAPLKG